MNLYEIDSAILECVDIETGEVFDIDRFEELNMTRDAKVESVCLWIKNLKAEVEALKADKDVFAQRQKAAENKMESLKRYISGYLEGTSFESAKVKVSYRKSETLEISEGAVIPEEYLKRQLNASKKYNLIPCKFPVVVDNPHEPDFETVKPKNNGWNLYHTKTNELITPEHMATTDKIKMSEWEMRNFGIVFVRKYLSAKQLKVLSFQDTLEVDPQIWFEDANGKKCWLLVRCAQKSNNKIPKPNKLNEIIRRCFKNNGYFAGVSLEAIDEKHLYRGGKINIEFEGIEKIHSVL